jgi:hypothetical protein
VREKSNDAICVLYVFEAKFGVKFSSVLTITCATRLAGLPLSKVRSEGRPPRSPVLQALIIAYKNTQESTCFQVDSFLCTDTHANAPAVQRAAQTAALSTPSPPNTDSFAKIYSHIQKSGKHLHITHFCYVNCSVYSAGFTHIEKGCGKSCGDCGKVCVFNSYRVFFTTVPPFLKHV